MECVCFQACRLYNSSSIALNVFDCCSESLILYCNGFLAIIMTIKEYCFDDFLSIFWRCLYLYTNDYCMNIVYGIQVVFFKYYLLLNIYNMYSSNVLVLGWHVRFFCFIYFLFFENSYRYHHCEMKWTYR